MSSSSVAPAFVVGPDVSATLLTPSSELELGMWMAVPRATTPLAASGESMPERRFGPSPCRWFNLLVTLDSVLLRARRVHERGVTETSHAGSDMSHARLRLDRFSCG